LWKRLDVPGHDAAVFNRRGDDWQLLGTAVFRGEDGPVAASYEVRLDGQYRAWRGSVRGFSGGRSFSHEIVRAPTAGALMGISSDSLISSTSTSTSASRQQQTCLRSAGSISRSGAAEFSVAWFDLTEDKLVPLLQRYRRVDARHYAYESPQGPYSATLKMSGSGFVAVYPDLWEMED
jgi:hypothetical protein